MLPKSLFALCVSLTAWPLAAQDKVPLAPRFEPGTYRLVHVQELESGVASPGAPLAGTKSTVEFDAELTAAKPGAKGQAFGLEIKRVRHTLREGGQITVFDSDRPPSDKNAGQPMLRALAGAKFAFVLDKKGKLLSASGAKDVWQRMQAMQPDIGPAGQEDLQAVHDFVLGDVVLLGRDLLPPSAAVGERWTVRQPNLPMQKQVDAVQCALLRVEKGQAFVQCSTADSAAAAPKDAKAPPKPADAPRQQVNASLQVNTATGLMEKAIIEVRSQQTFKPSKDEKETEPIDLHGGIRSESTWTKKQ